MPYIDKQSKKQINEGRPPNTVGELTYAVTKDVVDYLNRSDIRYSSLGEAMLALEAAKLELYRRVIAPYEDSKIESNGDVAGYEKLLEKMNADYRT